MSRFSETMKNRLLASGVSERIHSPVSEGRGHWFFRPPFCNKILGDKSLPFKNMPSNRCNSRIHASLFVYHLRRNCSLKCKRYVSLTCFKKVRLPCFDFPLFSGSLLWSKSARGASLVSLVTCSPTVKVCLAESSPLSGTPYALCLWPVSEHCKPTSICGRTGFSADPFN